jgi:hypothetical protein
MNVPPKWFWLGGLTDVDAGGMVADLEVVKSPCLGMMGVGIIRKEGQVA